MPDDSEKRAREMARKVVDADIKNPRDIFHPDWAGTIGEGIAKEIKKSPTATRVVQKAVNGMESYAEWLKTHPGEKVLSPEVQRAGVKLQDTTREKLYGSEAAERFRRDQDLERYNRDSAAGVYPQGEMVDLPPAQAAPGVRQPTSMMRDFSNEKDRAAYVEQVKKAASNAAKPKTDSRGPGWANFAVGEGRMKQIGQAAHDLVPQNVRESGKRAVEGYADWVTKERHAPTALVNAEKGVVNGLGRAANRVAWEAGQPQDYFLEHQDEIGPHNEAIRKAQEEADKPEVHEMTPITVESGGTVSKALKRR